MSDTTTMLVLGIGTILAYKFLVLDKKGAAPAPPVPAVGVPPPPVVPDPAAPATPPADATATPPAEGEKGDKKKKKKKSSSNYTNAYMTAYLNSGQSLYSLARVGNCL